MPKLRLTDMLWATVVVAQVIVIAILLGELQQLRHSIRHGEVIYWRIQEYAGFFEKALSISVERLPKGSKGVINGLDIQMKRVGADWSMRIREIGPIDEAADTGSFPPAP